MTWRTIITSKKVSLDQLLLRKETRARRTIGVFSCGASEALKNALHSSGRARDDKSDTWRQLVPGKLLPHCTRDVLFRKIIFQLFAC